MGVGFEVIKEMLKRQRRAERREPLPARKCGRSKQGNETVAQKVKQLEMENTLLKNTMSC